MPMGMTRKSSVTFPGLGQQIYPLHKSILMYTTIYTPSQTPPGPEEYYQTKFLTIKGDLQSYQELYSMGKVTEKSNKFIVYALNKLVMAYNQLYEEYQRHSKGKGNARKMADVLPKREVEWARAKVKDEELRLKAKWGQESLGSTEMEQENMWLDQDEKAKEEMEKEKGRERMRRLIQGEAEPLPSLIDYQFQTTFGNQKSVMENGPMVKSCGNGKSEVPITFEEFKRIFPQLFHK